jgi:CrcB protein
MSKPTASNSTSPEIGSVPEKHDPSLCAHQNRDDEPGAHRSSHVAAGVGLALAPQQSIADARSLASVDRLSTGSNDMIQVPSSAYHPFSPAVVALLMPASIFGVLARLGLQALATYDGKAIFPLAYPQAVGCLIMGIALSLKDTISS